MNKSTQNWQDDLADALAVDYRSLDVRRRGFDEPFPETAINVLAKLDIHRLYIPVSEGGKLQSLTQLIDMWRTLARLDLSLAIAHGKTFLGGVCTWIIGNDEQKQLISEWIKVPQPLSWGLTERAHGADLMATQTRADATASGWRLNGEKWLINNATRSRAITVLARTANAHGARSLSLFLVDKQALSAVQFTPLDKIQTHGIRGADISGIAFNDAELPASALIGDVGSGLETTLKALQLTRIACCGLSLGALEGALLSTLNFVQNHRLYGYALIKLDTVKETLSESIVTLWFSEITTWMAARVADRLPEELAIVSALTKGAIPSRVASQLAVLEEQMGARGFVTDLSHADNFAKRIRDHQIVPIFDGSTLVCRASLVPHVSALARHYRRETMHPDGVHVLAGNDNIDGLSFDQLTLISRTGCTLVQSIPSIIAQLRCTLSDEQQRKELQVFLSEADAVIDVLENTPTQHPDVSVQALQIIEAYEWLFIGACCLTYWQSLESAPAPECKLPEWLVLCLNRVNRELRREAGLRHPECTEKNWLKEQLTTYAERDAMSLIGSWKGGFHYET